MILVSLFITLAIVFSILTLAVSEVLLVGTPKRTPAVRQLPLPRALSGKEEIELTADSVVIIAS